MSTVRVVGLGIGTGKPVKREEAVKLVVDALIAIVNGPERFACVRINSRGSLEIHLGEIELELTKESRGRV